MADLRTEEISVVETGQMSSVETGLMSAVETGQISAAETGQMSATASRQMSAVAKGPTSSDETKQMRQNKSHLLQVQTSVLSQHAMWMSQQYQ